MRLAPIAQGVGFAVHTRTGAKAQLQLTSDRLGHGCGGRGLVTESHVYKHGNAYYEHLESASPGARTVCVRWVAHESLDGVSIRYETVSRRSEEGGGG